MAKLARSAHNLVCPPQHALLARPQHPERLRSCMVRVRWRRQSHRPEAQHKAINRLPTRYATATPHQRTHVLCPPAAWTRAPAFPAPVGARSWACWLGHTACPAASPAAPAASPRPGQQSGARCHSVRVGEGRRRRHKSSRPRVRGANHRHVPPQAAAAAPWHHSRRVDGCRTRFCVQAGEALGAWWGYSAAQGASRAW